MASPDNIELMAVRAELTRPQAHQVVAACTQAPFPAVCVGGVYVADFATALRGSDTRVCALASWPMGHSKSTIRTIEATAAAKDDAGEIEFVAHLPYLLRQDVASLKADALELVRAVRSVRSAIVVRMVIEAAALMQQVDPAGAQDRIAAACQAARESGCDMVVSATGYHPAGYPDAQVVAWMKKHSGGLYVKAVAPPTATGAQVQTLLDAGADRVGCETSSPAVSQWLNV